jgi:hypothetical protein
MADRGWKRPFDEPIPTPEGKPLVALKDAAKFRLSHLQRSLSTPSYYCGGNSSSSALAHSPPAAPPLAQQGTTGPFGPGIDPPNAQRRLCRYRHRKTRLSNGGFDETREVSGRRMSSPTKRKRTLWRKP